MISERCIVRGCENRKGQGTFIGDLCKPCYEYLSTGKVGPTTSFLSRYKKEDNTKLIKEMYNALLAATAAVKALELVGADKHLSGHRVVKELIEDAILAYEKETH